MKIGKEVRKAGENKAFVTSINGKIEKIAQFSRAAPRLKDWDISPHWSDWDKEVEVRARGFQLKFNEARFSNLYFPMPLFLSMRVKHCIEIIKLRELKIEDTLFTWVGE